MSKPVVFSDLEDVDPGLYKGLQQLMEYNGNDVEGEKRGGREREMFNVELLTIALPILHTTNKHRCFLSHL